MNNFASSYAVGPEHGHFAFPQGSIVPTIGGFAGPAGIWDFYWDEQLITFGSFASGHEQNMRVIGIDPV